MTCLCQKRSRLSHSDSSDQSEFDGKYYARTGTAKLKVIQDGWKNLKYLFQFKKKIGSAVLESPTYSGEKVVSVSD